MSQEQKAAVEAKEAAVNAATVEAEAATEAGDQASNDPRSREELLAEVTRLQADLQETQNRLLRATADFDNFRRRARQEKEELGKYAALKMIQEILPVLDNFQLALTVENTDAQALQQGIEMVFRQFLAILEREGLTGIEAVGQRFDPNFHEAVLQVESSEHEPGTVVEELRKGYILYDKVVRPSMVKVSQ